MDGYFTLIEHPTSEYIFWWSQSLLLVLAAIGAGIAFFQLRTIGNQARATLLLELDRRFESTKLSDARSILRQIREEAMAAARKVKQNANDAALLELMKPECALIISRLRRENPPTYAKLLNYLGFFETVGVMVARGYVTLGEISWLLRAAILDIEIYFGDHITERRSEPGNTGALFQQTLDLIEKARPL